MPTATSAGRPFATRSSGSAAVVAMVHAIVRSDHLDEVLEEHVDQRQLFQTAIAILPEDVVVRHHMGINEMRHGHIEEARRILERCLDLSPNNAAVTHSFGLFAWERAKQAAPGPLKELLFEKSLTHFRRVADTDLHSESGYHSIAALFLNRARYEDLTADKKFAFAASALDAVRTDAAEIDKQVADRLHDIKGQVFELLVHLAVWHRHPPARAVTR